MGILGITCQRDDGPYMVEWVAHHLAAGVDHMLVLSHDCTDGSDRLLDRLAESGAITHLPFTPGGGKSVQWQALKLARDHPLVRAADWVMVFDCDEFLCMPDPPRELSQLLARVVQEHGPTDAIAIPWRLFGSGGQVKARPGLTPERFTRAAPHDLAFPLAHLFKALHRPRAFQRLGVHRPRRKPGDPPVWRLPDGRALPGDFAGNDAAISLYGVAGAGEAMRLNHYSLRALDEFIVKRQRGLPNHADREIGFEYWTERNWNTVQDDTIAPMLAATRAEHARLMALPGVAGAAAACRAAHAALQDAALNDPDTLRLHFRLQMLTGSTPPDPAAARRFVARQAALRRGTWVAR